MPALLRIDQAGLPIGTPGVSRSDGLDTGALVTLTNLGGGATLDVRLPWVPPEDLSALPSLTQINPTQFTFAPQALVWGSYRIEMIVDLGLPTESRTRHTFGIRLPVSGLLVPSANELADPSSTRQNATEPLRLEASETNEPFTPFVGRQPFGWWKDLSDLFARVEVLSGAGGTTSLHVVDDFADGPSAWRISSGLDGSVKAIASGTPYGLPSSGVLLLKVDVTAGSKAEIFRWKTGLVLGPSSPIVIRWRFLIADRPVDASVCGVLLGIQSPTVANTGVAVGLSITSALVTAALITQTGGFGAEPFAFPAGAYFDVRLTVTETGTTVEIAVDGGAYATVLVGVNAPSQAIYVPWLQVARGTANGKGQLAVDLVEVIASRAALDGGVPGIDDSSPFESMSYNPATLGDWSGVAPDSVQDALDRIAAALGPIP